MRMNIKQFFLSLTVICAFGAYAEPVDIQIQLINSDQSAVTDGVVELIPQFEYGGADSNKGPDVAQKNRTFVPFVSAVEVGTEVHFPNYDKTRHHVYSFSKAKQFELKLYVGRPDSGIVFDKTGIVALGCNIHDYMQAYVYISESPFVQVSNKEGVTDFQELPQGKYQLNVWHPWQKSEQSARDIVISGTEPQNHSMTLTIPVEKREKPSPPNNKWQNLFEENAKEL